MDFGAFFSIVVGETAAEKRSDAEHREKLRRNQYRRHLQRFLPEPELCRCVNDRRHAAERMVLFHPVEKIYWIDDVAIGSHLKVRLPYLYEPVGLSERKGTQQDAVYDTEDRRARSDAESQGWEGDQGEEGSLD